MGLLAVVYPIAWQKNENEVNALLEVKLEMEEERQPDVIWAPGTRYAWHVNIF